MFRNVPQPVVFSDELGCFITTRPESDIEGMRKNNDKNAVMSMDLII